MPRASYSLNSAVCALRTRFGKIHYNMHNDTLSKELQEKAERELNEVPSETEEKLEHIRNFLVKQPHFNAREDNLFLLNFLRGCKFNLQKTKQKLNIFYKIRTTTPEFFENRDPLLPEIQECLEQGIILPLISDTTPTAIIRWNFDYKKVCFQTLLKVVFMLFDIMLNENISFMITGIHIIHDLEGFSLNCFRSLTPSLCKKIFTTAQRAYPLRITGIHFVNSVSYSGMIFSFFKPFMSKKLRDRTHVYDRSQFNKIYASISKFALPNEYGGEGGSADEITDKLKNKMESYRYWFLEDAKYRFNDNQGALKPKTCVDAHGVKESFRNLEID